MVIVIIRLIHSFDNRSLVSKEYVDIENANQNIGINHNSQMINSLLRLDGSKQMTGALDMNNNEIKTLKDPVNDQDAATKKWINTELNTKVSKNGDSINGDLDIIGELDMYNNNIINVADSTAESHCVNKQYVDNGMLVNIQTSLTYTNTQLAKKLDLSGGNMAGDINLVNSHKIINSPNP